jgi:hypothetical protein
MSEVIHERPTEQEPLLGRPGDATQYHNRSIVHNLVLGTAALAQAGIWIVRFKSI